MAQKKSTAINYTITNPDVARVLDCFSERFVQCIKKIDINLLQGVGAAELVDFMVDLVENPSLVVMDCVVLDRLVNQILTKAVDNLYFIEMNQNSSRCTAGNTSDGICLHLHQNTRKAVFDYSSMV